MDKSSYRRLFEEAVQRTLQEAGSHHETQPMVEFHGAPNPPGRITLEQALGFLWLASDRFYRIVDVGVFVGEDDPPVLFVRRSGHRPGSFSETWDPADLGPFKSVGFVRRGLPS